MRTFGLIGKSLVHSFSKDFFTNLFEKESIAAEYKNFELTNISEFKNVLIQEPNLAGLNVTIPYKVEIIPYLDKLSLEAEAVGAVNTIVMENNQTIGYNTDVFGFQQSIKPFLTFQHERALILGTGGAAKAIAYVLKSIGLEVLYASRNPDNKHEFSYDDINEYMLNACKLVVNCSPLGTFPNLDESPKFPYEFLSEEHLIVDLIYNPEKTIFLRKSQEFGATTLNGKAMLEQQALKSWELWNKK